MPPRRPGGRPNVLFLCADQFRFDCMGCAGNAVIRTPNLDRLASMGVRFDRAYSTAPLCIPARTHMLTGQTCWQTEVWGLNDRLIPAVPTFATELAAAGYFTGAVGKMHFKSCNAVGDIHEPHGFAEMILSEEVLPTDVQDEDDYTRYLKRHGYDLGRYVHGRRSPQFTREGYHAQASELPHEHFDTTWTGDETIRMLETHAGGPFCIVSSFVKPHFPVELPRDWPCPYRPEEIPFRASYTAEPAPELEKFRHNADTQRSARQMGWLDEKTLRAFAAYYYGNITLIDAQLGRILDALERLGLMDRTLVVFSSDHGECLGERGEVGKMSYHEESARVPMIAAGPMVSAPGRGDDRPVILEDLCATFLDVGGLAVPDAMMGRSMLPLLRDAKAAGRDAVFGVMGGPYHFDPNVAFCFVREGDWKYMYQFAGGREKLYDLADDPVELRDLADEPAHRGRCESLNRRLAAWFAENGAAFFTREGRLRKDLLA